MLKEEVYTQIQSLKTAKKGAFNDSCAIELIRSTGYVNIVDILLLPLYYTWEHRKYGTLDQVCFESYLANAYHHYSLSTKDYNKKIVCILEECSVEDILSHGTKNQVISLLNTYSNI